MHASMANNTSTSKIIKCMLNNIICTASRLCLISSTIQTLLSVPELHRFSPALAEVANYHRRSGISAYG